MSVFTVGMGALVDIGAGPFTGDVGAGMFIADVVGAGVFIADIGAGVFLADIGVGVFDVGASVFAGALGSGTPLVLERVTRVNPSADTLGRFGAMGDTLGGRRRGGATIT